MDVYTTSCLEKYVKPNELKLNTQIWKLVYHSFKLFCKDQQNDQ